MNPNSMEIDQQNNFTINTTKDINKFDQKNENISLKLIGLNCQNESSWDYVPKGARVKIFYIQEDEQENALFQNKSKFDIEQFTDQGQPLEFVVGEGKVSPIFEKVVQLMKKGQKAMVTVPQNMIPSDHKVPPGFILKYFIKVIDFDQPHSPLNLQNKENVNIAEKMIQNIVQNNDSNEKEQLNEIIQNIIFGKIEKQDESLENSDYKSTSMKIAQKELREAVESMQNTQSNENNQKCNYKISSWNYIGFLFDPIVDQIRHMESQIFDISIEKNQQGFNMDDMIPGFQDKYNQNIEKQKQHECEQKGIPYTPDLDKDGKQKRYQFDYGDFIAQQVKKAKLIQGKKFDDNDYQRIKRLVNQAVTQHIAQYKKSDHLCKQEKNID